MSCNLDDRFGTSNRWLHEKGKSLIRLMLWRHLFRQHLVKDRVRDGVTIGF